MLLKPRKTNLLNIIGNLADLEKQQYDILTEFNLYVENVKLTYQMLNYKMNIN